MRPTPPIAIASFVGLVKFFTHASQPIHATSLSEWTAGQWSSRMFSEIFCPNCISCTVNFCSVYWRLGVARDEMY